MSRPELARPGKKNTSLRLDEPTLAALKRLATEHDTSVQKLIETLIRDYLSTNKKDGD